MQLDKFKMEITTDTYLGDSKEQLKLLSSDSVDLIVTSPPYADQRSSTYGGISHDKYVEWFLPISQQLLRVLKPTGTFVLNIKEKVVAAFGDIVLNINEIDKIKLAEIVFNDPKSLQILNNIIHPIVLEDFNTWANNQTANTSYVIQESAILFESGFEKHFDKIIVVTASLETRIKRIKKRDNLKEAEILKRINNQMSDEIKIQKADYLIKNSGEDELIIPQVINIHNMLLNIGA